MSQADGFQQSFPDDSFADLNERSALRLLRLGLSRPSRPVDALIDRLLSPGGHEWFRKVIQGPTFKTCVGDAFTGLISGRVMLVQLTSLKEAAKSLGADRDRENRLVARVAYDLAIAAALAHHGRIITGQKRSELLPVLTDLADALPEPWADMVVRATDALDRAE
ncbi:MAG: hypothetical protein IT432_10080 [Phycisphaerales bacterium]|nr:hypothetical protein [Phycisphaerales bacterium]